MREQYFLNVPFAGQTRANCQFFVGIRNCTELPREKQTVYLVYGDADFGQSDKL